MDEIRRITSGLDAALVALDAAAHPVNVDEKWIQTRNVLNWLYHFEECLKSVAVDYYVLRDDSSNGRTLGGLIWLRGNVVHSGWDVHKMFRYKIANTHPNRQVRIVLSAWPERSSLPEPARKETHNRDLMYDEFVATKPMSITLNRAREFLLSIRAVG